MKRNIAWTLIFVTATGTGGALPSVAEEPNPTTQVASRESAGTITLNIDKGEIGDALRLVAEQGGLNLVVGPEVKGEVSVYLANAKLETALRAIAVNNGFAYSVDEGVITVSKPPERLPESALPPPPMVTRVFTLRSMDAERVRDALEYALTKYGKMKVLNENSNPGYGSQRLTNLAGDFQQEQGGGNVSAAALGGNGAQNGAFGGAGNVGAQTGLNGAPGQGMMGAGYPRNAAKLVVTDVAENVDRIAELVADLDRLPPQVLIEARIVEMSVILQRQLGIDWDVNVLANGPILNHELPLDWRAGFASGSQVRRNASGTAQSTAGLALGSVDFSRLTALLRIHQSDNAVRLLANPRLLVYNNHSASILVGERYPILQANITDFGTVTEAFDTYIPVGVQLEVTPTIMMDGSISILVHPATSSLGDDVVGTTGLRVARILTREIDTRVIMQDGDTIVLGGLISDRKTRNVQKIPGLGDLPVLDVFFRQENPGTDRVDLLVFLTARVQGATEINERDQRVFDMYKPQFKQIDRVQDVPVHFEVPTEFEMPRPMFGDPTNVADDDVLDKPAPEAAPGATEESPAPTKEGEESVEEEAEAATEQPETSRVVANRPMKLDE
ncbi:Type IV pilus biogenesis and competence protein PilQ precursor [Phycisphaerae bacterium RAS2]|nr:Type IV pilus biogenesis and competence protein PilQ precursor [Phycisphaerae bacterium RAS2]